MSLPLQHGLHEIVVVEGADRIGGRVKDVQFGGITVELGANWIHYSDIGEDEVNPVEELVRATRLNTVEDNYDDLIFRYRGIYISTSKYICRSTAVSRCIYQLLGKNVTEEYYKVTPRLNHAMEEAVKVAERKEKNNEVIISAVRNI